ncbi:MauE/DoxX family redox-associated membrane protein [Parapedobacter tibetensis]|uniref:MauE/DoxX family redox-associated membrane protein n=1 Tax=Parapedobacter tibetensis TaxID=2972951 RepID=UPI00214DECBF|nr:MauE/DoxX family redox-associated membrane protein [Parapedobacter tibetensis]
MNKKTPYIDAGIRLLFIALYTYTGMTKLLDFPVYRIKMRRQPFPEPLKEVFVWGVPTTELLMAIVLVPPYLIAAPKLTRGSLAANLLVIGSFTVYTGLAATGAFGYVPCSCGGFLEGMGWWVHFLFNLVFTLIAALGVWLHRSKEDAEVLPSIRG